MDIDFGLLSGYAGKTDMNRFYFNYSVFAVL